jgi:hypothetical protein
VVGRNGDYRIFKKGYQWHTFPVLVFKHVLEAQGTDSASLCSLACLYVKQGFCTGPSGWEPIPERLKRVKNTSSGQMEKWWRNTVASRGLDVKTTDSR